MDDYVGQLTRSAETLEKSGYILAEDRQRMVESAMAVSGYRRLPAKCRLLWTKRTLASRC